MHIKSLLFAGLFGLATAGFGAEPNNDDGLALIQDLGSVNGVALACAEKELAAKAKSLMLTHAPKTQAYGDAFQAATQESFLAQAGDSSGCATSVIAIRLDALVARLNAVLPVPPRQ